MQSIRNHVPSFFPRCSFDSKDPWVCFWRTPFCQGTQNSGLIQQRGGGKHPSFHQYGGCTNCMCPESSSEIKASGRGAQADCSLFAVQSRICRRCKEETGLQRYLIKKFVPCMERSRWTLSYCFLYIVLDCCMDRGLLVSLMVFWICRSFVFVKKRKKNGWRTDKKYWIWR